MTCRALKVRLHTTLPHPRFKILLSKAVKNTSWKSQIKLYLVLEDISWEMIFCKLRCKAYIHLMTAFESLDRVELWPFFHNASKSVSVKALRVTIYLFFFFFQTQRNKSMNNSFAISFHYSHFSCKFVGLLPIFFFLPCYKPAHDFKERDKSN